ncbi:methionine ABC transporter ATP-binding protein [Ruminiclostridium josui]|uniref:methionine ABC transporter ATP-binding protein n=1 Tax=Ruminiclostridium josui TaxID=1499 RepID=UPI0004637534|nr:methionine ABC transporter ATP-binding protein [Ruminiclostridium josui]
MIRLENVSVEFKQKKEKDVVAVKDVSLHIRKGEIFGIVGTSGAGKSSLIRTLNGLQKPTQGRVFVDGEDITNAKGKNLRNIRRKIGMIFQHFNLISRKTVGQNIEFALKIQNYPKQDRSKRVKELLEIVGLSDKEKVYPANLSGGQKQRVAIARALAANPKVLLCDEATSALDVQTTEEILQLLRKINRELEITIVFITHQLEIAKTLFDRIAVMSQGVIIEENDTYQIFASPSNEITQSLIKDNIKLPLEIVESLESEILKLVYKGDKSVEPIISLANKKFDIILNILHGKIEYIKGKPIGILFVTLEGPQEECERAKQFISDNVEEITTYYNGKKGESAWNIA